MKAKNSLCAISRAAAVAILFALGLPVAAQKYERLQKHNLWNQGSNVAALRLDSLSFSEAALSAEVEGGGLRSFSAAPLQAGGSLIARSTSRLDAFTLRGSFGFRDTESWNQCGSMSAAPGFFPIDAMEFTEGRKSTQNYIVQGAISVPLSERWYIGAGLDFSAINASKRKDLRYTTYRLDLEFSPSLLYRGEGFAIGASLGYARNSETVNAEQIGTAQTAPMAFLNEGIHFGNYQVWTGSATHLSEAGVSGLPQMRNAYKAALQFGTEDFFAELCGGWSEGRSGERQSIWYRFKGPEAGLNLAYRHGSHTFRASGKWSSLINRESVLDKVTEGGISLVKEYGSNKILEYSILESSLCYEYVGRVLEAGALVRLSDRRDLATPRYPYSYGRESLGFGAGFYALAKLGSFELGATLDGGAASIKETAFRSVQVNVSEPFRMEDLHEYENWYESVPRLGLGLNAAYYFFKKMYLRLDFGGVKALSDRVDTLRGKATVEIGLTF